MARKGKDFELAYKWLYELDTNKYKVTSPAFIYDRASRNKTEIDVLIEYKDNSGINRKIGVECRHRKASENKMWIEQLCTKKEDLELDYLIATTTSKFTVGAINKAKYHEVIIEEAEYLDKNILDSISNDFFVDYFFMRYEVHLIKFLIQGKIYDIHDLFNEINVVDKYQLLRFLNTDYFYSIDIHSLLKEYEISISDFYENDDDNFIENNCDVDLKIFNSNIIKKLNIDRMFISFKMIPFKSSLLLNKSLSIFDVDPKSNKKFRAFFGNDEEFLDIYYLEDGKVHNKAKFKERNYYRFVGSNMRINTVFPKKLDDSDINMEEFVKNGIGEFDLTKLNI